MVEPWVDHNTWPLEYYVFYMTTSLYVHEIAYQLRYNSNAICISFSSRENIKHPNQLNFEKLERVRFDQVSAGQMTRVSCTVVWKPVIPWNMLKNSNFNDLFYLADIVASWVVRVIEKTRFEKKCERGENHLEIMKKSRAASKLFE